MENKKYHLAQFGTYDIESLGDTTFPKMLRYGLESRLEGVDIELFSMTHCDRPYNSNPTVYSFDEFEARHKQHHFDAVIIGGGEFLHFRPMEVLIDGEQRFYPEGYIWKRPVELAVSHNIPFYFNCVGVAYDFTPEQAEYLQGILPKAAMVSVRDEYSALRLKSTGIEDDIVSCVADNLWYMNRMYPAASLDLLRRDLEKKNKRDYTSPYMIVQYGTTKDIDDLALQLDKIAEMLDVRVYLMAVNYCHEDLSALNLLKQKVHNGKIELLEDYMQPVELMAVISGAMAFVGTSLHGNLTAASYGVPFVGIDMYDSFVSKMDGIFTMLNCEQYLAPSAQSLFATLSARLSDKKIQAELSVKIDQLQGLLDMHFDQMASRIKGQEGK